MVKSAVRIILGIAFLLAAQVATAEPIKLKLAFVFSDRTSLFVDIIKPFVDAVNAEARETINIEVYSGGQLGKNPTQQAQLVLDGTADLAFVLAGMTPRFSDNAVIELPGLYQSAREASTVYTRLATTGALRGFEDFFVIGAFAAEPESFHSRRAIATLDDLKGQKIRSSSALESAAFAKLGIEPVMMPAPAVTEAISSGTIDGAAVMPVLLQEFGIGRVTSHHYLLRTSTTPIALLMNRKTFDSLPLNAQAVIRRHSGEQAAQRFSDDCERAIEQIVSQLKSDPRRKVVVPTPSDVDRAQVAFTSVIDDWAAKDPHHQHLLRLVNAELTKLRATR